MDPATDAHAMEAAVSPGGSAPLAALQDTALKAVGIAFLLNAGNALPFEVAGIVMQCLEPSASGPDGAAYRVTGLALSLVGTVFLAAAGVLLLLRACSVARRLWPGGGQDAPSPLTFADILTHFVSLAALYLLIPALGQLPRAVWQARYALATLYSGISHVSSPGNGGEELLQLLTLVFLCAFSIAKARPLGAWMARRAGLAG